TETSPRSFIYAEAEGKSSMAEDPSERKPEEKSIEMRVSEIEDKLAQMHITEDELKAFNKVSAALGQAAPQPCTPAPAASPTLPLPPPAAACVVQQCAIRQCTIVSHCTIRPCTIISNCTITHCTIINPCTIISQCTAECGGGCAPGGGGFAGGGFGTLGG
ncbi:MAG: hypothetical protein QOF69_3259, partial [Solirubrobacteraceae bacterium]|nr:hypothetical protein [Solirubrobacteraceae bacterium]